MRLNRLERHLIKLKFPFIRVTYLPSHQNFKVKGGKVTVEAEVNDLMNKVLQQNQELIPVCLKRKMEYKGNIMQEIVSRGKMEIYYDF